MKHNGQNRTYYISGDTSLPPELSAETDFVSLDSLIDAGVDLWGNIPQVRPAIIALARRKKITLRISEIHAMPLRISELKISAAIKTRGARPTVLQMQVALALDSALPARALEAEKRL